MRSALQLDFVAPRRRGRAPGIAVLAVSLGLAGAILFKYDETQKRLRELDAVQALLAAPRAAPRAHAAVAPRRATLTVSSVMPVSLAAHRGARQWRRSRERGGPAGPSGAPGVEVAAG
jgi:hypothetical protein